MQQMTSIDPVTLNLWYPIVAIGDAKPGSSAPPAC